MTEQNEPCFETDAPTKQLNQIQTPFGLRGVYDSISFCNRCGSCIEQCPTYRLTGIETYSPRGRNQAARLILEGKLKIKEKKLQASLSSCTLCGRCTQVCGAKIPTSQHVLEMHRASHGRHLPFLLQTFLSLRGEKPRAFQLCMNVFLKGKFLWKAVSCLPGLSWLKSAAEQLPGKIVPLQKHLKQADVPHTDKNPKFIYLPSFEAEFLQPQIALSSLRLLNRAGKTDCWLNTACGLFEYVYGDLRQSKRLLRRLIQRHRQNQPIVPLVTDSLDVYHFLKLAPQLFSGQEHLANQAQTFADSVRFITEFFNERSLTPPSISLPVQLDYGALFSRESAPLIQSISLFKTLFKQNFVECEYTAFDTPAFGYAFVAGNQNAQMMLEVVKKIAQKQTKTVFTFSGLCALELNKALSRLYPDAEARHIVCIADKI